MGKLSVTKRRREARSRAAHDKARSLRAAPPQPAGRFVPPPSSLAHKLTMGTAVGLPFLGTIAAIVLLWRWGYMGWPYLAMLVGGWFFTGLGITIGFHRLLTHRSFDTYRWVRVGWMLLGALSVEGSPLVWCAVHRRHHELSDQPGDPHSPHLHGEGWWNSLRGLWYAHAGWLFSGYWSKPDLARYVPDLMAERPLVIVDRLYVIWVLASLAIPTAIGAGIEGSWRGAALGLVWGGLVRIFVTHHITWSINSICHVFGRRDYEVGDDSRNNWVCGWIGLGEGWHNNHHAFPTSARHGLKWWQLDASWLVIRAMQGVGLAWNVRLPTHKGIEAKRV